MRQAVMLRGVVAIALVTGAFGCDKKGDAASKAAVEPVAPVAAGTPAVVPPAAGNPAVAPFTAGGGTQAVDGDACATAVGHFYEVLAASGTAEEKATYAPYETSLKSCREDHWVTPLVDCCRTLTTIEEWQSKCFKLAFDGSSIDLRPKRTFDALEYANGKYADVQPPPLTADGDLLTGGSCSSIMKTSGPAAAIFVMCGGQVVAGPLTTVPEVQAVFAQIAQQDADAYELGRRIRARWPSGCSSCKYKVYDQNGNYLRDE